MPKWVYDPVTGWQSGTPRGAGLPPAGEPPYVGRGTVLTRDARRYDKPTDDEIKKAMAEDHVDQGQHVEDSFYEAKRDLASGKLRVHPDALRANRREIIQEGDREVIVPASMAPVARMAEPAAPPVAVKEEVAVILEPPRSATPLPGDPTTSFKGQIRRGFAAITNSDGSSHIRRTF